MMGEERVIMVRKARRWMVMMRMLLVLWGVIFMAFTMQGCSTPKVTLCGGPGDTSPDHFMSGMEALQQGMVETAKGKFERAVYCDKEFSPAYGGLSIVHAHLAAQHADPAHRDVERRKATDFLKTEAGKARTDEDEVLHHLAVIRTVTTMGADVRLAEAEGAYRSGKALATGGERLIYYGGAESLDHFMGLAYLKARQPEQARGLFSAVLNTKKHGKWHADADRAWKRGDMMERAFAGGTLGDTGKKIAAQDTISRRDLAVLLVNELGIDTLFAGHIPSQVMPGKRPAQFLPVDISSDPFRTEMTTILKWRVRGLEAKYDGTAGAYLFSPDEVVTRGEMALILEDVIIKLTGDDRIAAAYLGHTRSPFPDVKTTSPFYNAIMGVTTRGIMEPCLSGEFKVNSPTNGADAVLAVRVLKQKANPQ